MPHPTRRAALLAGTASALALAGCATKPSASRAGRAPAPGGGELYFEVAGTGPALVLLHGFTLDTRMWDDQFAPLSQHFRVVRYDLRGFGQSTLPSAPYVHADDCAALMDHLQMPRAHLVGLSAGGRVALDVAVRHPARVARLAVLDTFIGGYLPSQGYRDSFGAMIAAARAGNLAQAKQLWLDHPLFAQARTQPAVAARLRQMVGSYSGFHWSQTNPETALVPPTLSRLKDITAPTLVMVGQHDIPDVQAQADVLMRDVRGAQRSVIAGAGHMVNMEAPAAANSALMGFLRAG